MNPTGSFKDRGMCVAVAKAVEDGYEGIVCASTGNTAASAAAYGARAGLTAVVLTPQGAIAAAKSAQSRAVAAKVAEVNGSFDDALRVCLELADRGVLHARQLAQPAPDRRPEDGGVRDRRGARPRARRARAALRRRRQQRRVRQGLLGGGRRRRGWSRCRPPSARRRSPPRSASPSRRTSTRSTSSIANGRIELVTVDDSEITAAWLEIASGEGLFCEPSSAAGYAGLAHVELEPGSTVVAVLTGHGLKDTAAVDVLAEPTIVVQPNVESILAGVSR